MRRLAELRCRRNPFPPGLVHFLVKAEGPRGLTRPWYLERRESGCRPLLLSFRSVAGFEFSQGAKSRFWNRETDGVTKSAIPVSFHRRSQLWVDHYFLWPTEPCREQPGGKFVRYPVISHFQLQSGPQGWPFNVEARQHLFRPSSRSIS
jgi:hypothetical protein